MADVEQVCFVQETYPEPRASGIKIRSATRSDMKQVADLLRQLSTVGHVSDEQLERFSNIVSTPNHQVFLVTEDERVLACTTLLVEQKLLHSYKKVGHIEDVVVDEQARGRGLGKILIQFVLQYAE